MSSLPDRCNLCSPVPTIGMGFRPNPEETFATRCLFPVFTVSQVPGPMSLATASGAPKAKKFRYSPEHVLFDMNQNQGEETATEAPAIKTECSVAESSSFGNSPPNPSRSTSPNESAHDDSKNPFEGSNVEQTDEHNHQPFPFQFLLEQASQILKNVKKEHTEPPSYGLSQPSITANSIRAPIPGALAVAASPAAKLFSEDDWSWHRNPAAAIRSGGTNKQTPVWKYFVYNKAENLSRCIIGDCTYMLKGPHTSTLACHLKKHPEEYAEFQKLKVEYTRDRNVGTLSNPGQRNGRSSANSTNSNGSSTFIGTQNRSGSSTPSNVSNLFKKSGEQNNLSGIFGNSNLFGGNSNNSPQNNLSGRSKPMSVNEILNNLSASAVSMVPNSSTVNSHSSMNPPINPVSFLNDNSCNPLHFLNLIKQGNSNASKPNPVAIVQQIRKWPRQDRKQKEMEQKMALFISSAQLPSTVVHDLCFREFLEQLQPKFYIPEEEREVEQIITQFYQKTVSNIKAQLAVINKFTLLLDILRHNKSPTLLVSICVAFYSQTRHKVEVVLLGIRTLTDTTLPAEGIRQLVNETLSEYDLGLHQVSRTILSGLSLLQLPKNTPIFSNQLSSHKECLEQVVNQMVIQSENYIQVCESVQNLMSLLKFFPDAANSIKMLTGVEVEEMDLNKPLEDIANVLIDHKDAFCSVIAQYSELMSLLAVIEWTTLEAFLRIKRLFKAHMQVIQDNSYATIDRVVPSIMQLLMSLEKDFVQLEDLPQRLVSCIREKLGYILDPSDDHFDPTFIEATALNPQLVVLLDENQINHAREGIEKRLQERIKCIEESTSRRNGKVGGVDSLLAAVVERKSSELSLETSSDESPAFCASSLYPDLVQAANQRRQQIKGQNRNVKNHYAEAMVQAYFDDVLNNGCYPTIFGAVSEIPREPLSFWQWGSAKCPPLSEMAIELLSIPSSTISPEMIGSQSTDTTFMTSSFEPQPFDYIKNCLNEDSLERDAVIRFNRAFWQKSLF
ncbi:unnamed protein product [Bursaphelenchus xylophilus]|uniref:(pine wood nematode) hypothetical protein n=1 Tax=Bursaphelenchus xylophilus TaxID=6326 RepID=A0A811L094_BURXY|nr:unnamed protein product [Bursaphelenchus xylophilus]CAG9108761.1 unnamed protein product [Bursaphelenchus xylophilus]